MATALQTPEITVTVESRESRGKAEAGRLRRQGLVPAVVYGGNKPPVPISVEEHAIREVLKGAAGDNTIFLLKLEGTDEERLAMIKELQSDPISGHFLHIDFIRITRGHKLTVTIPVELTGDSVGVRHGGRIDWVTRDIEVEILPRDMLDKFVLDISDLDIGDHLKVSDLAGQTPEDARLLTDEERVVVVVHAPRAIEELEPEAVEGEELLVEEAAEPELIGRSRDEEEQESE